MPSRLDQLLASFADVNAATIADDEVKVSGMSKEEMTAYISERLSALGTQVGSNQWFEAVGVELRRLHIGEYAVGKGGFDMLTPEDRQILEERLKQELDYLFRFATEAPDLSEAQIEARLQMYVSHGNVSFNAGEQALHAETGATEMRRELNPAEHCFDCVALSAQGWQPMGALPLPGDGSECRANCACSVEYR